MFNVQEASTDVEFASNGMEMMHRDDTTLNLSTFQKISGTTSSHILSSIEYWEVFVHFFMGRVGNADTAFEIGICSEQAVDRIADPKRNYKAYCCTATRGGKSSAVLEYFKKGSNTWQGTPLGWQKPFQLHLGFFLNANRREFSIIHVNTGNVLFTFTNIKICPYTALFDAGNAGGKTQLKIQLLTGENIRNVPEVVYKDLL